MVAKQAEAPHEAHPDTHTKNRFCTNGSLKHFVLTSQCAGSERTDRKIYGFPEIHRVLHGGGDLFSLLKCSRPSL